MLDFFINHHSTIADFIALLAFAMSGFQLIRDHCRRRTNISLELQNFELYDLGKNMDYILLLTITNKSDSPISITKLLLIDDYGKEFSCHLTHRYICEHYYNKFPETDIPCTERIFSPDFPICLPSHGCTMPFIVFSDSSIRLTITEKTKLHVRVITDKKEKWFSLSIPENNKNSLSI